MQDALTACVEARQRGRPALDELISAWKRVTQLHGTLRTTLDDARGKLERAGGAEHAGGVVGRVRAAVSGPGSIAERVEALTEPMRTVDAQLEALRARILRDTINIGVLGHTRSGKSTFLQTATTLGPEVIPSNATRSTTAAPSEIYHRRGPRTIRVEHHSWSSFEQEYLRPLGRGAHLNDLSALATPDTFRRASFDDQDPTKSPVERSYLEKLRTAVESWSSYESLLGRPPQTLADGPLRPLVAQPDDKEDRRRPYHAVRRVTIHTDFGEAGVDGLGLIDLPGFGESALDLEAQIHRIRFDIDVLLAIRRPTDQTAQSGPQDHETLGIAARSAGEVALGDFLFWVFNRDRAGYRNDAGFQGLVDDLRATLQPDEVASEIAEVTDRDAVVSIMQTVVRRLAARLPAMDAALVDGLGIGMTTILDTLDSACRELNRLAIQDPSDVSEESRRAAGEGRLIRGRMARGLDAIRAEFSTRSSPSEVALHEKIATIAEGLRAWCRDGFGEGAPAVWRDKRAFDLASAQDRTREEVFGDVRLELDRRFSTIDLSLDEAVDHLCDRVAELLRAQLGTNIVPMGKHALEHVRDLCERYRLISIKTGLDALLHVRTNHGGLYIRVGRPIVRTVQTGTIDDDSDVRMPLLRAIKTSHDLVDDLDRVAKTLRLVGAVTGLPGASQFGEILQLVADLRASAERTAPELKDIADQPHPIRVVESDRSSGLPHGGPAAVPGDQAPDPWYVRAVRLESEVRAAADRAITRLVEALDDEATMLTIILRTAADQLQDGLGRATNIEDEYVELFKIARSRAPEAPEKRALAELVRATGVAAETATLTMRSVGRCRDALRTSAGIGAPGSRARTHKIEVKRAAP